MFDGFVSRFDVGRPVGLLRGMMTAGLLLMITPGFALGAPHQGDPVLDAICVSISGKEVVSSQKTLLCSKFLAWANLGIRGVVVGCMVGVEDEHGFVFCLCNVDEFAERQSLIPCCNGCLVGSDFQVEAVVFGGDKDLIDFEGCLIVIVACIAEHLE
eukprot:12995487-Ditylum_brightwellii.AAC.1